ncbi:2OG-Fe(II) oxygenase [Hyphobacterium marinum]|uniref:2OG-Fe(II) oxygenase n=1 Tax=Hyphobacterium marinum TaxID=3116574 RepID=A0ABU7LV70_9PROT|nr:2OG-Fe(II) oxygenase [Hyphobacterium sp. Y6023]MEE2565452.1 2OG-Fe(II) oxygenase [Hyphobacterium sp. Y6023]
MTGNAAALIDAALAHDARGDAGAAVAALDEAVASGDPSARIQAALWTLYGANYPRDETAAFRAIDTLAADGERRAMRLGAVMRAFGLGCRRDWAGALDGMTRAAEQGDPFARADLSLLDGANAYGDDPALWQPPRADLFLQKPRVEIFRAVIPAQWCLHVLQSARPFMAGAHVKDARTGARTADPMRTNSVAIVELWDCSLIHYAIAARVARACRCPVDRIEPPKILRYQAGETYRDHFDFIDPDVPAFAAELRARGQRTKTPLIYLNDSYVGGETAFLKSGTAFRGRTGDLLVLRNTRAGDKPDRDSLHAGLPPTQGEKWVWSSRVRTRPQLARLWREF